LVTFAAVAVYASSTPSGSSVEQSSHVPRTPTVTVDANDINSYAVRRGGGQRDRIDYFVSTLAWARYRVTYYESTANMLNYFRFRVGIAGITEFTGAVWSETAVVSRLRLCNRPASDWSSFVTGTTPVTNADGSSYTLYTTSINGLGNQAGATVTITARLASGFGFAMDAADQATIALAANKIKFDIEISNYNYTTPGSQLAIVTVVQAIDAVVMRAENSSDPNGGFNVGAGGHFMWFNAAWHTFKNGSSAYQPIITTTPTGDVSQEYQLTPQYAVLDSDAVAEEVSTVVVHILSGSNEQPTKIQWDPEVSVVEQSGAARIAVMSTGLATLLALLAATFAF